MLDFFQLNDTLWEVECPDLESLPREPAYIFVEMVSIRGGISKNNFIAISQSRCCIKCLSDISIDNTFSFNIDTTSLQQPYRRYSMLVTEIASGQLAET